MVIGERLRQIRESKNLSQGDVEKKTGLLRCYLSRCENGHTIPSSETLAKWSRALDVSMSQLFAENGEQAKPLVLKNENDAKKLNRTTADHLRRIEAAFLKLDPRDQVISLGLIRKFASK